MMKAVIFDLDGTLSDSLESIAYSANLALKAIGLPSYETERYKQFVGDGVGELVRRMLYYNGDMEYARYDELRAKYREYFREYCMYRVHPYEGLPEVLLELKKKGVLLTVLSNKPHKQAVEVVEELFGTELFTMIQGQSSDFERKPSPEGAFYIARSLSVEPSECLYVGDTDTDMKTGKSAGMYTVGVLWGFRERQELEENHADEIIETPDRLLKIVERDGAAMTEDHAREGKENGAAYGQEEKKTPVIRLVATDVDGTLVKDSSNEVYPEIIEAVRKLHEKDILFVVASGRQYYSLVKLFDEVQDDMIFIAENGAHIRCRGTDISVVSMDPKIARELILESRRFPGVDVVVSTAGGAYLESKNQEFLDLITYGYQNKFTLVEDILKEDIDIIKVALYHKDSIREIGENILVPKWKDLCKACMAGEEWVDFMDASVDKGNALKTIQDFFHISREETMVFGDNGNDVGMLNQAEESYVVSNARDDVKRHAKHLCAPYSEKGVYRELQTLF